MVLLPRRQVRSYFFSVERIRPLTTHSPATGSACRLASLAPFQSNLPPPFHLSFCLSRLAIAHSQATPTELMIKKRENKPTRAQSACLPQVASREQTNIHMHTTSTFMGGIYEGIRCGGIPGSIRVLILCHRQQGCCRAPVRKEIIGRERR